MDSAPSAPSCTFVIPAAGSGTRFGASRPKQYVEIDGVPIIVHTLRRCLTLPDVGGAVVAVAVDQRQTMRELLDEFSIEGVRIVVGGATRQQSVLAALEELDFAEAEFVAVHDAVRPFFSPHLFAELQKAMIATGAAIPLLPVADTLHRVSGGLIAETPNRDEWGLAQTPQCFRGVLLRDALRRAEQERISGTDEAAVVSHYGGEVRVVRGEAGNFKITHPNDLERAEAVMRTREEH